MQPNYVFITLFITSLPTTINNSLQFPSLKTRVSDWWVVYVPNPFLFSQVICISLLASSQEAAPLSRSGRQEGWPQLRCIITGDARGQTPPPKAAASALKPLASRCSSLHHTDCLGNAPTPMGWELLVALSPNSSAWTVNLTAHFSVYVQTTSR